MSQYTPDLESLAKELIAIQDQKELLKKFSEEKQSSMKEIIRKIFEEGILPSVIQEGYRLIIKAGNREEDWEMFLNAEPYLKSSIENYAEERYGSKFTISFYLDKGKRGERSLEGQFILDGREHPALEFIMFPLIPQEYGRGTRMKRFDSSAEISRKISLDNMSNDLLKVIKEYEEKLLPSYQANQDAVVLLR